MKVTLGVIIVLYSHHCRTIFVLRIVYFCVLYHVLVNNDKLIDIKALIIIENENLFCLLTKDLIVEFWSVFSPIWTECRKL